jgi:hypothetical protein
VRSKAIAMVALSLVTLSPVPIGASPSARKHDLERSLEDAVLCKPRAWDDLVQEPSGIDLSPLSQVGVTSSEYLDGTIYALPADTHVFKLEALHLFETHTSVDSYYVELKGDASSLELLKDKLRLRRISEAEAYLGRPNSYGYRFSYVRKFLDSYDSATSHTIEAGVGQRDGGQYIVIGCELYSGDPG